jgi:hypothetical protein
MEAKKREDILTTGGNYMAVCNIMSILVDSRSSKAIEVQKVLSENGCIIKTRLGIHEADGDSCSDIGIIILNLTGTDEEIASLEKTLNSIKGVNARNTRLCN